PFTPVSVTPSTNAFCARKKTTITGAITSSVAAIVRFHCTWWSDRNSDSPIDSTQLFGVSPVYSSGRKKSLNVYRNENRATAAIAGFASRSTTVVRIRSSPLPSILAASKYSSGIVRKNCRSRKIENASPSQFGRITGQSVPTRPSFAHITYSGTTETCGGSISAISTTRNAASRPRQRMRASAYATGTLETSRPSVASVEYSSVFSAQRQSGAVVKTSTKLCQANGCGHSRDDSAWSFVISAVRVMKTNGARKTIDAEINRLWFATASRNRRRRTGAGGFRRLSATGAAISSGAELTSAPRRSAPSGAS